MIKLNRTASKATGAIFFDFDEVLHRPNHDGIYHKSVDTLNQKNPPHGNLIDKDQLLKIGTYAEVHHIPLYIVSHRPKRDKPYLCKKINELTPFYYDGLGGFKRENIFCLGIEALDEPHNGALVAHEIHLKLIEIQTIYQSELSYLPKTHLLFIHDKFHPLDSIKQAGFTTQLATGEGHIEHLSTALDFMRALVELPFLNNLGHYAVLDKAANLFTPALHPTEYITPASEPEFQGKHWRKYSLPDFSALAKQSLEDPTLKDKIAQQLQIFSYPQAIFFTRNQQKITEYVIKNSVETFSSLEILAEKDIIILLGSESRRKAQPLLKALEPFSHLSLAIITMPADSGVDKQPLGHLQTQTGAKNRLDQLLCFRETLQSMLDSIIKKKRLIACLAIENGIGAFPVERVAGQDNLQMASMPLLSDDLKTYCFYDQAHLFFSLNSQIHYQVSQPMKIGYTFLDANKEALITLLDNKPTYFELQKQFSHEMRKRLKDKSIGSPFPIRQDGSKTITSDDCIEAILQAWFHHFFSEKISISQLKAEFSFFKRCEAHYLESNRSSHASIQQAYDKQFGLVAIQ